MNKLTTKHKIIILVIIIAVLFLGVGIFQALGFWKTILMAISYILGIISGWYFKYLKDKYFISSKNIKESIEDSNLQINNESVETVENTNNETIENNN